MIREVIDEMSRRIVKNGPMLERHYPRERGDNSRKKPTAIPSNESDTEMRYRINQRR